MRCSLGCVIEPKSSPVAAAHEAYGLRNHSGLYRLRESDCLATINFPCWRQLEVPVDELSLEPQDTDSDSATIRIPGLWGNY